MTRHLLALAQCLVLAGLTAAGLATHYLTCV